MTLNSLKEAISLRAPIKFEYNKPGKTPGLRIGNPHAVFIMHRKDGSKSVKVHLVQTAGVSDSEQPLPSFRMFDLDELSNVEIIQPVTPFTVSTEYNPQWEGYRDVIAKI